MIEVSTVIPTRNRKASLYRLLTCLNSQTYPIKEVMIIDSSDETISLEVLKSKFEQLKIRVIKSKPSVCIQRNIGIREANSDYIFVCDDDIQISEDYIFQLMTQIKEQNVGVVSGLILQKENDSWVSQYPPKSFKSLLFAFIFQQSIWGEINNLRVNRFIKPLYKLIQRSYLSRGNSISLAGWPIITNFHPSIFRTRFYGLGASIIKRECLIQSPYDEVLDPHGIGDNYGMSLNLPEDVVVLTEAKAYHHQSDENRLDAAIIYYRRILALHYFLTKSGSNLFKKWWFIWSLMGNLLFHKNRAYRKSTRIALVKVIAGNNPYWKAYLNGDKCIEPEFRN